MASYNRLNPEDTTVSTDKVVSNTWSDDTNILENHFTSSTQTAISTATSQGNFFWEVYASSSNQSVKPIQGEGPVQYTVSYGHRVGSGSLNLRLDNATNIDFFTDDSITQTGSAVTTNLGRQFNLVSGSDGVMSGSKLTQTSHLTAVDSVDSGSFGFVYPEAGVIIFNAAALRKRTNAYWTKGTAAATENIVGLMCGAIQRGNAFELDSEERVSSQYMFVRVKNSDFNYSSNPSYIDTNGNLNNTTMVDSPTTYITTVGLYNDDNNLLAVAKLSQPLKKDFTTEALVRIKLDY